MRRFENLEKYIGGDEEELAISMFEFICQITDYGEDISELSQPQKNFYYIQLLEAEINNGGFDQYFFNSAGEFAQETILALGEINAIKTVTILQSAIECFPNKIAPKDRFDRQTAMEEINNREESFDVLDEKFYKYEDNITVLLSDYIIKNKAFF